ncbi:shikimate dehydrogenase [Leifsonia sp. 98AMF]|uniref:shikimate dehydrogenase n=1 Tax=unclassified Leifsonia TaxID=2663824 RepID=UPI00087DC66C|nr:MULTISPECIES: shikimate dehydrogenase [unclassified Leifsonia]SDH39621.1 shikimate dehydrogenase [Leifsonia sp. 197AMF]SDI96802.1 shikimate dehydrogenase [Leifsonia sp. 466MF]SDJ79028.1 shikimate dehydrogenase [Leifsonia sp. 157MF]SDO00084.1 shikimate dehydrogenase [Leifsonia sp. 509MF]SEN04211.1 shikimate dehydrogenase [Leifsonia sp. 467MF]
MSDTSKQRRDEDLAEPAVLEDDTVEESQTEEADERAAVEDGVSEASAEASIAALVEAEREREAEEAAVEEAEEAVEREAPHDEPEPESETAAEAEPESETASEPEPAKASTKQSTRAPAKSTASKPRKPKAPSRKLAVLGSPIGHSKSPQLHRAAYEALGMDWSYEAIDVTEDALPEFIAGLGPEWRGLSLTMPLKKAVLPLLTETDRIAEQTGGANTVLLDGEAVRGFNTDVAGIVRALQAAGLEQAHYVHILGGGATAASALVAAAELGADRVDAHVRDLERSAWIEPLANQLGLRVRIRPFAQADRSLDVPDLVISTLPGGTTTEAVYTDSTRRRSVLFDVAYEPWPTPLARQWESVGGRVVSGLAMLAHQALLQVRVFVSGDPLQPLEDEEAVLAAMLDAVGIDAQGAPLEV